MAGENLGPTGGVIWSDWAEWERRRTRKGCVICRAERPLDVIAETATCWITAGPEAPLPGYLCVISKEHVNEPFELAPESQSRFWIEAMAVARAVATETRPVKMNYEIHGNTLPHLHLHLFPRRVDDPYVGGPVDPRRASFHRSPEDLQRLQAVVRACLGVE
jgi:diadenosine tetraphosphate (Ap4A) HIT family hydrolase